MPQPKPINPFYIAALPIGIVFAITACAYVVMMVQTADARQPEPAGLIALLQNHGIVVLIAQLVVLALLTFAAILSDDFWTRRFEARYPPIDDNRKLKTEN